MAKDLTDIVVAGYGDTDIATEDFDALVERVGAKQVTIEGAILVTQDEAGNVTVQQTGDHRGRKGAGWGGAAGFLVGLVAPPLLASLAVGTAAGAVVGRFADHKQESGPTIRWARRCHPVAQPSS